MPLVRLCDLLDKGVSLRQEVSEVVAKHFLERASEEGKGRSKAQFVAHACSVVHGGEVMFVFELGEAPLDFDLAEEGEGPPSVDETGVIESETEVAA